MDRVNPGLIDLFIKRVREAVQKPERISVPQKLKQKLPTRKSAAQKKWEPER